MAEEKKTKTLREQLNALTFSNRQAGGIANMQSGSSAVKSDVGRKRKTIPGSKMGSSLQSLKNTLGTQFSSK